jgi:hypothetical protein
VKLEIEKVNTNYDLRGGHRGRVIVFADWNRPFNKGDINADFAWRRTHNMPYPKKEILAAIAEKLSEFKINPRRIIYSKKAGCSMCPCSPGYVIYDRFSAGRDRIAIYLREKEDGPNSELVTNEKM